MLDRDDEIEAALGELVARAHAVHDRSWVTRERFVERLLAIALDDDQDPIARLRSLEAADVYLTIAAGDGVAGAIAVLERDHVSQIGHFVARVDASPAFADEIRQRLRSHLLTAEPGEAPPIAKYAGRGPFGGWLRVVAVRAARAMNASDRRATAIDDIAPDAIDPELENLKAKYGAVVSDAFRNVLEGLGDEERTLLRMHYVDGLSLERVASVFRVSRATAARSLARTRAAIVTRMHAELRDRLGVASDEADSLLELVRSRIDMSLRQHLKKE